LWNWDCVERIFVSASDEDEAHFLFSASLNKTPGMVDDSAAVVSNIRPDTLTRARRNIINLGKGVISMLRGDGDLCTQVHHRAPPISPRVLGCNAARRNTHIAHLEEHDARLS